VAAPYLNPSSGTVSQVEHSLATAIDLLASLLIDEITEKM
jgi:hypothetical protein